MSLEKCDVVSDEITKSKTKYGLSLLLGTAVVTIIYVSVNVMFYRSFTVEDIGTPEKDRVGIAAAQAILAQAELDIALMILIASFGGQRNDFMGARVYKYGKDGLFLRKQRFYQHSVPANALWILFYGRILSFSGRMGIINRFLFSGLFS